MILKTIVVARARYAVASGQTRPVALHLSSAGMRLLERARHRHLRVRASATLSGGPAAHGTIVLRLKPPAKVLVSDLRTGGLGGNSAHLVVTTDGRARLAIRSVTRRAFLAPRTRARLTAVLRRADFAHLKPAYEPTAPVPDTFTYTLTHAGHTVRAADAAAPPRLRAVIRLLDQIVAKLAP